MQDAKIAKVSVGVVAVREAPFHLAKSAKIRYGVGGSVVQRG